jgi:hypothetical protein
MQTSMKPKTEQRPRAIAYRTHPATWPLCPDHDSPLKRRWIAYYQHCNESRAAARAMGIPFVQAEQYCAPVELIPFDVLDALEFQPPWPPHVARWILVAQASDIPHANRWRNELEKTDPSLFAQEAAEAKHALKRRRANAARKKQRAEDRLNRLFPFRLKPVPPPAGP